jgi:integrase
MVCGRDNDAMKIIEEQGRYSNSREGRIFPYNGRSIGTAFRLKCKDLKIEDLHFHDLRHEGTSRLFEAGFSIEQVALVTGHKDWKMLRRYTHIKPETLHTRRGTNAA